MKIFWRIVYSLAALFMIPFLIMCSMFLFDNLGNCKSDGGVWDYDQKTCRQDCLYWNKTNGCIKLTDEELAALENCKNQSNECFDLIYNKMYPQKCLENNGVYNLDQETCDYDFELKDCYKLEGNWQYPKACESGKTPQHTPTL